MAHKLSMSYYFHVNLNPLAGTQNAKHKTTEAKWMLADLRVISICLTETGNFKLSFVYATNEHWICVIYAYSLNIYCL